MLRISRADFTEKFPVQVAAFNIHGIQEESVIVESDVVVSGILKRDLVLREGTKAIVHGIIEGSMIIEEDAVVYFDGIVKHSVDVRGAACLQGLVGSLTASDDATVCLENFQVTGERAA